MSTHRITGCEAIGRSPHEPSLAWRQVPYVDRGLGIPWMAVSLIAIGIVCGVALILIPAAIQAARYG